MIFYFLLFTKIIHASFPINDELPTSHIFLCVKNNSEEEILLNELIENQLLLISNVLVDSCKNFTKQNNNYIFRQEVKKIENKFVIISALYNHKEESMFGLVEHVDKIIRSIMSDRVKRIAVSIENAIFEEKREKDVFLEFDKVNTNAISMESYQSKPMALDETKKILLQQNNIFGLKIGLESRVHFPVWPTNQKKIATKSFLVIGANFDHIFNNNIILKNGFYVAYMDLGIARPIIENSLNKNLSFSFLFSTSVLKNFYENDSLVLFLGFENSWRYFNSKVDKIVANAALPIYNYTYQGFLFGGELFSVVLNTAIGFIVGFSPFLQNFSQNTFVPLQNFAWEVEVSLSANLYKSFYGLFSIHHNGQSVKVGGNERVVTYGQMAYLSLLAKL